MSIPPRLANKLHETLGAAASGDFVMWLDEMRREHTEQREATRADFAELRQEMLAMEGRLTALVHAEVTTLRGELHAVETRLGDRIQGVEVDLGRRIGEVAKEVEKSRGALILWSFVFWVGAVTSIAFLARALKP